MGVRGRGRAVGGLRSAVLRCREAMGGRSWVRRSARCGRAPRARARRRGRGPRRTAPRARPAAPLRRANEVNRRCEAVLPGEIVVSSTVVARSAATFAQSPSSSAAARPRPRCAWSTATCHTSRVRGSLRPDVPGDEPGDGAGGVPRHDGRGGEVPAPQQIAVRGVEVEHLRVAGDAPDCGSVGHLGPVDPQALGHFQELRRSCEFNLPSKFWKLHRGKGLRKCSSCVIARVGARTRNLGGMWSI